MANQSCPKKIILGSLLPTISMWARSSIILGLVNGFALTLDKWAAGSFLLGTFRKNYSFSPWHGSRVLALLQFIAAKIMTLLEAICTTMEFSFQNSITGKFFYWCIAPLKHSFAPAALDLLLAFIAANLIIRLLLKAYAGTTLFILTAGFLGFLLLRFHAHKLQATFQGSLFTHFLKWFFTLETEDD